ncbi:MAG: hypothetical protein ABIW03_06425 [Sphingomicrobium sp.]
MLIETVNAVAHGIGKTPRLGDIGAAGTARHDQVLGNRVAVLQNIDNCSGAAVERSVARGLACDEVKRRGEAGPDCLEPLLKSQIVGLVQLADPRGIAAAPQILEQQRVIKIVQVAAGKTEGATDMAANPARANAMPGRLTLGDVERIAERADELG